MNRKGQYYLVAVVLICIAIFSLLSVTTQTFWAEKSSFGNLWENCYKESVFVFNQAVKNSEDIFNSFKDYADDYKQYSKTIDSSFGFIYLATNLTGATRIRNLLESDIDVSISTESLSTTISKGNYLTDETEYVNLTLNDVQYDFQTTRKPNIQFLFWQEKDGEVRVKQK